jgi:hypothetical protein
VSVNLLYLSPNFPPNYQQFIVHLTNLGIKLYGIGEGDFYDMPENVRQKISWYVRTSLADHAAVDKALDYMIAQNPQLQEQGFDIVEGHNEAWLRLEGYLNERFKIKDGVRPKDLDKWKKKNDMKKIFLQIGLKVAKGDVVATLDKALAMARNLKYPVILKPNEGVGASGVHCLKNEQELQELWPRLQGEYLIEEFIHGDIVTYDGLTDHQGRVIFENSLIYSEGILDCVIGKDPSFYVTPSIPAKLSTIGKKVVKAFDIRRKFFHFEYFVKDGDFIPIEVNCRPPGGPILDMINYSVDDDLYYRYALLIARKENKIPQEKKYYCGYVGRRDRHYHYNHHQIRDRHGQHLIEAFENMPLYWEAMGRYRYIFRATSLDKIKEIMRDLLTV